MGQPLPFVSTRYGSQAFLMEGFRLSVFGVDKRSGCKLLLFMLSDIGSDIGGPIQEGLEFMRKGERYGGTNGMWWL